MTIERFDVAVVGAGPAGATTAALLSGVGHRVVLLDRSHFPRSKACAEFLSPGVGVILARLGLAGSLPSPRPFPVPGMELVSPDGSVLRLHYSQSEPAAPASTMQRRDLDFGVVQEAGRRGADVREGIIARGAIIEGGTVSGVRATVAGREQPIRARLTVIADGARSTLAGAIGLARPPRWPVRMGLIAYYAGQAHLRDGFGQMHVSSNGYCGVAPLGDDLYNIGLVVPRDAVLRSGRSASMYVEHWIETHASLRTLLEGCRRVSPVRGVSPVGARSRRTWMPGSLLVGDAAGFFDPFTGEGIYRALRGAELAAACAIQALNSGDVSGGQLAGYEAARRDAFRSKDIVTALVQLFVEFPWLLKYATRRLSVREEPRSILTAVLGDVAVAEKFLQRKTLWGALRP